MQALAHRAVPVSQLPGVLWPALPGITGQRMLAMQFQFSQSERWPLQKLREAQFAQLALLLRHARDTVPFYRERLSGVALDGSLNTRTFANIPLLRRADVQSHFKSMVSSACPPEHGAAKEGQTSGSTGRPISFLALNSPRRSGTRSRCAITFGTTATSAQNWRQSVRAWRLAREWVGATPRIRRFAPVPR